MENLLDDNFTPEQKKEAIEYLKFLSLGRSDIYLSKLFNSGKKMSYEQIKQLKQINNPATITLFKVVYKR